MKIKNEIKILIEKEEGLAMLEVWESMGMAGMKMYADLEGFLNIGGELRKFKEKETNNFIEVNLEDYIEFSVLIITNHNLIKQIRINKTNKGE